jgi:flagellar motor switch protein FliM
MRPHTTPPAAPQDPPVHQLLDPCHLGRPMHLLGQFNALLHEDLSAVLKLQLGQRCEDLFRLGEFRIQRLSPALRLARWITYATPDGRIGFHVDRPVLLSLLACRYGTGDPLHAGEAPQDVPETATEERLFHLMGQRLTGGLLSRMAAGLDELPRATPPTEWPGQRGTPPHDAWLLKAPVRGADDTLIGHVLFALDEPCMERILHRIAPARPNSAATAGPVAVSLEQSLRMHLRARLLEKRMALGQVLDLQPGHVIPVSLTKADVLVRDSVIFNAAVVEHKGKLCLTSFEEE